MALLLSLFGYSCRRCCVFIAVNDYVGVKWPPFTPTATTAAIMDQWPLLNLRSHKKRINFERRINSESNPEAREMLYRPVLCQFQMFYRLWKLCQLPFFPLRSKFILLINLASLTRTVFFRPTVSTYTLSLFISLW